MKYIDNFLNSITMYRLVLFVTGSLSALGIVFGFAGTVPYSGIIMLLSAALSVAVCVAASWSLSRLYRIPANSESSLITALILFLIMPPAAKIEDGVLLALAGILAMCSKYVLAIRGKHLFNPAAIAVFLIAAGGLGGAVWWVGSAILAVPAAIGGFLIVQKIRRWHLVLPFAAASLAAIAAFAAATGGSVPELLGQAVVSWPLIFFAGIMLTEPLTAPATRRRRMLYGLLVGLLFGSRFHLGFLYSTPETALILGNIFSYLVSPARRFMLRFRQAVPIGPSMYDFVFDRPEGLHFKAGQYLEWTLKVLGSDARGNRRYFTIASSPSEQSVRLGVKIPPQPSAFKRTLQHLQAGDVVAASQLAGDFVLPGDVSQKLVFIAGGIGITPFRSMIKFLIDSGQKRDAVLFYASADAEEFAYREVFSEAQQTGIRTQYILSGAKVVPEGWHGHVGYLTADLLRSFVPDYSQRLYYLSGPNAMVDSYKKLLIGLGIHRTRIKTDYFPGY